MMRIVVFLCLCILPLAVSAQSAAPDSTSNEEAHGGFMEFEWGIEATGFAIGSFMDEPSESNKVMAINGVQSRVPYSGFAGVGGGGGMTLNALWKGIIGLQVGLWKTSEKVEGSLNIIDYRSGAGNQYDLEITKDVIPHPCSLEVGSTHIICAPMCTQFRFCDAIPSQTRQSDPTAIGK